MVAGNNGCNHTLHHSAPGSTWVRVLDELRNRWLVECSFCGAFYGCLRPEGEKAPKDKRSAGDWRPPA